MKLLLLFYFNDILEMASSSDIVDISEFLYKSLAFTLQVKMRSLLFLDNENFGPSIKYGQSVFFYWPAVTNISVVLKREQTLSYAHVLRSIHLSPPPPQLVGG